MNFEDTTFILRDGTTHHGITAVLRHFARESTDTSELTKLKSRIAALETKVVTLTNLINQVRNQKSKTKGK